MNYLEDNQNTNAPVTTGNTTNDDITGTSNVAVVATVYPSNNGQVTDASK